MKCRCGKLYRKLAIDCVLVPGKVEGGEVSCVSQGCKGVRALRLLMTGLCALLYCGHWGADNGAASTDSTGDAAAESTLMMPAGCSETSHPSFDHFVVVSVICCQ